MTTTDFGGKIGISFPRSKPINFSEFISLYLHFLCESLNEPLHLPWCSYFMNNIASRDVTWHPWMRGIWAYQRQGHPITLFVY